MYELRQITENCFYIDCPAKIGVVKTGDNTVCLIDSGLDREVAKKTLRQLDELGLSVTAIYNTHSNADHVGGNKYIQDKTGCKIYAPASECAFTRYPILEPAYLYGGYPPKELRNKFFVAETSDARELTEEVLPEGFKIIKLPGHFFDMVGFLTPDGVAYIADCISSKATLEKYAIGVVVDVEAYIKTLEELPKIGAKYYVPSHAEVCSDIKELADYNIAATKKNIDKITELLREEKTFDELIKALFDDMEHRLNFQQYALVGSTIRSYLTYLLDKGDVAYEVVDNRLLWRNTK